MPSFSVTVSVRDRVTSGLAEMADRRKVLAGIRRGAAIVSLRIAENFRQKNRTEPNRFVREGWGSRRSYFWRRMADSIKPAEIDQGLLKVRIPMNRIVGFKHKGGTIVPKKAKALTIPVHPDAYARRASRLETALGIKLFVLRTKLGDAFLAGRRELRKGRMSIIRYYILKRSVTIGPWPGTLPARELIRADFRRGIREVLTRKRP